MIDPEALKNLRNALKGYSLLYVEDHVALNSQATQLFEKIFEKVYSAHNGEEGLKLFKAHHPMFVITDIKMPKMDGIEMAKEILSIDSNVKVIFVSAYDEPEFLHEAIRLGASDYLVKPITITNILEVLLRCIDDLSSKMHERVFNMYLQNVFNYQQNLILLIVHNKVVMANQRCLDFFDVPTVKRFNEKFERFGDLLLEHSGFLYNHDDVTWLDTLKKNPGKLYNAKIADHEFNNHHFVINIQRVPEKNDYYILSLNDVSELNLLKLFDPKAVEQEAVMKDKKTLLGLFEMAKRNNAKIRMHNLYRGLSITNDGLIEMAEIDRIMIKTAQMQLKAIQLEGKVTLISDIFPVFVDCTNILKINFEQQYVELGVCKMTQTSPTRRQYIRVPPDPNARATLLFQGHKFDVDIDILDVSMKATRWALPSLPAGFGVGSEVILDFLLGSTTRPMIINTAAKVFRIFENGRTFEVVFEYNLHEKLNRQMIDYIAKRQMYLIREFKAVQYGD